MCEAHARYEKEGIGWNLEGNGLPRIHELSLEGNIHHHHHHHHKHQGMDPLISSVSKVTTTFSNVSSVFQLWSVVV